jgi:hypothetical protein
MQFVKEFVPDGVWRVVKIASSKGAAKDAVMRNHERQCIG